MKTYRHRGPGNPHGNGGPAETPEATPESVPEEGDGLDQMTARELRAEATARGLDIAPRATKAAMIAAIRENDDRHP